MIYCGNEQDLHSVSVQLVFVFIVGVAGDLKFTLNDLCVNVRYG